ncbi:MAG: MFS transporter, partial [Alphaproteobacteria bacterium]|nr:MFS transporter [Alphaproteobacteria bacterium]
ALWFVKPDPAWALFALAGVALANFGFEMAVVFYNAMLPGLTTPGRMGRLSGWAWGLGYAGGLSCLAVALIGFALPDQPWFGLTKAGGENIRATAVLTALWMAAFALPVFVWTPDSSAAPRPFGRAVVEGLVTLWATLKHLREHRAALRFLLARMIYTDGLNTLFAFGGIYAAGTFGMDFTEIIAFGIAINVTAGLGAAGFGWVDDRFGPRLTILIALAGLFLLGAALLVAEGKIAFWALATPMGLFVGPAQAASRTFMAHLAPKGVETEMFGLYALSGKATAFVGPLALGWAAVAWDSQRAGMATILAFFVVGGAMLWGLKDPRPAPAA